MALNNFFEIPKWQPSRHDRNAAGPVAHELAQPPQKATYSVIGADSQVEFREEITLRVHRGRHLDLRVGPQTARRPPQLSNTIEVKCRDTQCRISETVVISAFPYGFDWFATSRFKLSRYDGRRRDAKATEDAYDLIRELQTASDPQAVLEGAKFDPFETRSGWLTARFVGPFERTEGGHVTVRARRQDRLNSSIDELKQSSVNWMPQERIERRAELIAVLTAHFGMPGHAPLPKPLLEYLGLAGEGDGLRRTVSPYLLWGLCEDFEECRNQLRNCEQARQWLKNPEELLSSGRLHIKRPGYELAAEAAELFCQLAEPVLDSSIIKALAGVPRKQPSHWKPGVRRLVFDLVSVIYQDSMLNLAKRLGSKPRNELWENGYQFIEPHDPGNGFDVRTTAEDEEKVWKDIFMRQPPDEDQQKRLFHAARAMLDDGNEKDIIGTCGMLAAAAATMMVPPDVVVRLKQITKEKSSDLTSRGAAYAIKAIARHGSAR